MNSESRGHAVSSGRSLEQAEMTIAGKAMNKQNIHRPMI